MTLKRPYFDDRPIGSVRALALALGVPEPTLLSVARTADTRYRGPIIVRKPGRKPRETYDALPSLKNIQKRILDRIVRRISLPDYLLGGVKGRSYVDNAAIHARSKILLGEDIDSFYPSVPEARVRLVFKHVFRFPPLVAAVLTKLCTRKGTLVQGGVVSTDLANLALYRTEPQLAESAKMLGLRYSRFVDDIHASTDRSRSSGDAQEFLSVMRRALEREGFKPKRKKQFVNIAGKPMRVHGLNVSGQASVPQIVRQRLRNEVFLVERWAGMQPWDEQLDHCFLRVSSKVGHLKQTNPGDARRLQMRLRELRAMRDAYLSTKQSQ